MLSVWPEYKKVGTILFKKIEGCAFSSQDTQLKVRNEKPKKGAGRRNTVWAKLLFGLIK